MTNKILDIFNLFTNELNQLILLPDELEKILNINFYDSEHELLEGVLKHTPSELLNDRKNSPDFKEQCIDGTINFIEGKAYIHLLRGDKPAELVGYTYIHELVHVCNQIKYYESADENIVFEKISNPLLHLWDEYSARYYSSVVFLNYEINQGMRRQHDYDNVISAFVNQISCDDFRSYEGSQYLGFIGAMLDVGLIPLAEMHEYLKRGNSKETFDTYRQIKNICFIKD